MARFPPGGALDTTFGNDGKVSIDMSPTDEQIEDLALVQNGKIVAAGYEEASLTPGSRSPGSRAAGSSTRPSATTA